jgi:hypothetical protein
MTFKSKKYGYMDVIDSTRLNHIHSQLEKIHNGTLSDSYNPNMNREYNDTEALMMLNYMRSSRDTYYSELAEICEKGGFERIR